MKTRQYLRVPLPLPVKVKVLEQEDEEFNLTRIDDLSWGGAFILVDPLPPLNSRIIIKFESPEVALELWGSVVRSVEPESGVVGGVGIQFDTLDDETRSVLQQLVENEIREIFKSM